MPQGLFWLKDQQWKALRRHLPDGLTGPKREEVDDRRIISGIIHMLQSGGRWRDCPREYGPHTTIYNRFNRWSKRGRWRVIFEALAKLGKDAVALSLDFDLDQSSPLRLRRKRGERTQAIGRSRGGRTTKIHALSDPLCRPVAFHLTPGQDADIAAAPEVLALAPAAKAIIADKGYDGDAFRAEIKQRRARPIIPNKSNRVSGIASTNSPTRDAMSLSDASAGSRTSGELPPDTTNSPETSSPQFTLLPSSHSGSIKFGP